MNQLGERELLNRIRQGDEDAFRELYRRSLDGVFRYLALRVGGKHDAEELTQEVFAKAVRNFAKFQYQGDGSYSAWLRGIARHALLDFYRRQNHRPTPLDIDDLPEIISDLLTPEQMALQKERFVRLHNAVRALPPRRREVVTLHFFVGLANHEIAAHLRLDQRTVASNLSRALDDLRRRLGGGEIEGFVWEAAR